MDVEETEEKRAGAPGRERIIPYKTPKYRSSIRREVCIREVVGEEHHVAGPAQLTDESGCLCEAADHVDMRLVETARAQPGEQSGGRPGFHHDHVAAHRGRVLAIAPVLLLFHAAQLHQSWGHQDLASTIH